MHGSCCRDELAVSAWEFRVRGVAGLVHFTLWQFEMEAALRLQGSGFQMYAV